MNPLLIVAAIEGAAAIIESGQRLLNTFTGGEEALEKMPPDAEVQPGLTVADVRAAIARGRMAAQRLTGKGESILERLDAEGKLSGGDPPVKPS